MLKTLIVLAIIFLIFAAAAYFILSKLEEKFENNPLIQLLMAPFNAFKWILKKMGLISGS
jgi:hypothetical protein